MAHYLATVNFTAQGITQYKQTTQRTAQIRADLQQRGIEVIQIWWSMGPHDGFIVFRAADDEAASSAMLAIAGQGFVSINTHRVFDEDEIVRIIG